MVVVLAMSTVLNDDPPGQPQIEPQLITASAVRSRVAVALASLKTLRGEIAMECEISYGPMPGARGRRPEHASLVVHHHRRRR